MLHGESGIKNLLETQPGFSEDISVLGKETTRMIATTRGSLILDQPFFGYILSHLTIFPTTEKIEKFVTDGNYLYFNSKYINDLIRNNTNWRGKIKGILIHLLMHLIFHHTTRSRNKIPKVWAFACDIAVFQLLLDIKDDWKAPEDWDLPDLREVPEELRSKNAETIYQDLLEILQSDEEEEGSPLEGKGKQPDRQMELQSDDEKNQPLKKYLDRIQGHSYRCDIYTVIQQQPQNDLNVEYRDQYFQGIIRSAYEKQKGFGDLPGDLDRYISQSLFPRVNWRTRLTKYLQSVIVHDLSWKHPNKRLFGQGYLLPGVLKENITVLFGLDTSGSVSEDVLSQVLSEAQQIMNSIVNVRMILVDCDAKIQQIRTYMPGEPIRETHFKGGGGTDFRPVFDLVKEYTPDVIIYCTDGMGQYPESCPTPCIWVLTTDVTPPFGEIIRFDS